MSVDGQESEDIFISPIDLKDAFNMDVMVELKAIQQGSLNNRRGKYVRVIETRSNKNCWAEIKNGKRELVLMRMIKSLIQPIYVDHAHSTWSSSWS